MRIEARGEEGKEANTVDERDGQKEFVCQLTYLCCHCCEINELFPRLDKNKKSFRTAIFR